MDFYIDPKEIVSNQRFRDKINVKWTGDVMESSNTTTFMRPQGRAFCVFDIAEDEKSKLMTQARSGWQEY